MKTPEFITFTGIDDRTSLKRCDELAATYPIEWGVLFSHTNKDARYPSIQTINELQMIRGMKSLHLCGKAAWTFAKDKTTPGELDDIMHIFSRMQVNGVKNQLLPAQHEDIQLIEQCSTFYGKEYFDGDALPQQLFDLSGGKGLLPAEIPSPAHEGIVGYAGGMGPDTVMHYLGMIEHKGLFWIDMESRVRTNGWLDLDKVEYVCNLVYGEMS